MVSQALYSPRSDGRQNYRTAHNPYHYLAERRSYPGSLPQHNIRVMTMTDQGESDSSSQRKRISVAVSLHLATLQHSQNPISLQRASLSRLTICSSSSCCEKKNIHLWFALPKQHILTLTLSLN
jgi:hypothetical protein